MRIKPFHALRPEPENAAILSSPPYDVVSTAEAADIGRDNPISFIHVIRPEIDLPEDTDTHADEVYGKARENFQRLIKDGALIREAQPCLYLYAQTMGEHTQYGVVAVSHVEDYENDIIRKHEKTRKDKEDDRTRHVSTLNANAGPVFLTYRADGKIDALTATVASEPSLFDFVDPAGVRHVVWRISDTSEWISAFGDVPIGYVADGHHRSASAARVGAERRAANPQHTGEEEYNWFLTVLFPSDQLNILPYNRCVRDLNGLSEQEFLEAIAKDFSVSDDAVPAPSSPGHVSMYLGGNWHSLSWDDVESEDPVASLDVSVLQDRLLAPVLGIDDPRKSDRIDFIGGIRGTDELERRVNSGDFSVAFSMYPVTVDQLMAIADAGKIMPPKSTWFEPKLRSGLLVHTLD
ncbi:MAG: DUF1015 family protein [Verrucomicrobia bacterium]|nr:DUF1015 family protein [Verrucomicrobiota bacterium]